MGLCKGLKASPVFYGCKPHPIKTYILYRNGQKYKLVQTYKFNPPDGTFPVWFPFWFEGHPHSPASL